MQKSGMKNQTDAMMSVTTATHASTTAAAAATTTDHGTIESRLIENAVETLTSRKATTDQTTDAQMTVESKNVA